MFQDIEKTRDKDDKLEQDCDIIKVEKEVNKKMQGSAAVGQLRLSLKLKPV